jgi:hypothetical protein
LFVAYPVIDMIATDFCETFFIAVGTSGGVMYFPGMLWTGMYVSSLNSFPMTATAKSTAETITAVA